jgi:TonB family protein
MKKAALWFLLTACATLTAAQGGQRDSKTEKAKRAMCDAAAPKLHESGTNTVVLRMTVNSKGRVESFTTESPKGLRLEKMKEAATAIKAIEFTPATKDGSPVAVQIRTEFDCAVPPGTAQGTVGDVPGGLPPDRTSAIAGILSSEPQLPRVGSPTHIRVAQGVMQTFLVRKVSPIYPPEAERQRVEGSVLLHIDIDKNGNISKIEPVSGHSLLIPASIDAVKQWKYKPYLLNQAPVDVETTVLIRFVISGGNAYSVIAFASPKPRSWR